MTGACTRQTRVFPRSFTQGGSGQVKGDKALMGGLMRVDIDLMGGPNFDRLCHKSTKSTVIVKLQLHDAVYWLTIVLKLIDLYLMAFKFTQ